MAIAMRPAPAVPASRPVSGKATEEFTALKHELNVESWDMAPNNWDAIQIAYAKRGTEQQARSFVAVIQIKQQEIL
ncbi:MAG: hypothetical protein WCT52_02305 [Candidatus Micrarchaeia archaeon]|jgi:hypothetical protein